jgi:hypothetical protein
MNINAREGRREGRSAQLHKRFARPQINSEVGLANFPRRISPPRLFMEHKINKPTIIVNTLLDFPRLVKSRKLTMSRRRCRNRGKIEVVVTDAGSLLLR